METLKDETTKTLNMRKISRSMRRWEKLREKEYGFTR